MRKESVFAFREEVIGIAVECGTGTGQNIFIIHTHAIDDRTAEILVDRTLKSLVHTANALRGRHDAVDLGAK